MAKRNTHPSTGTVCAHEAYSKQVLLQRMGISQKFWDTMLDEGLPYTQVGHSRWVTGQDLIEHLRRKAERKGSHEETTSTNN
jgi:hypothetical protein